MLFQGLLDLGGIVVLLRGLLDVDKALQKSGLLQQPADDLAEAVVLLARLSQCVEDASLPRDEQPLVVASLQDAAQLVLRVLPQ